MKHIEVSLMGENELSIDGQSKPDGNIEIREFEDGEWMGGSYTTFDNLVEFNMKYIKKIKILN